MNVNFPERLKAAISATGLTQAAFARRIQVSPSLLTELLKGRSRASRRTLQAIAEASGTSIQWLDSGEGEMLRDRPTTAFALAEAGEVVDIPGVGAVKAVTLFGKGVFAQVNRLKAAFWAESDWALSELLRVPEDAVLKWVEAGRLPGDVLNRAAGLCGIGREWLEQGPNPASDKVVLPGKQSSDIPAELIGQVVEELETCLGELKLELSPAQKARLVVTLCETFREGSRLDKPTLVRLVQQATS